MNEAQVRQARAQRNPDNLYQRDGVWWIRYNAGGRKIRRSLGTRSLREARRLRDQILAKRSVAEKFGLEAPIPRKQWTFAEVVEAWHKSREANAELRPSTLRSAREVARFWILPRFANRLISEITVEDVEAFITYLRHAHSKRTKKPLRRAYIAKISKYLNTIFRFAQKRQMHHGPNPFDQLEKRPTTGPGRDVAITEDEARRLLAKLTGATYYKVALALSTGLRWGEIHGLAWEDVELGAERPSITIRRSWRGDPKTETSAATIAISDDAAATLRRWKTEQGEARYLFPDRTGQIRKGPYRREETTILEAAKEAGIVSNVTPHVFRHSFATWAYERVRDPRKLQKLMRHASFQTSMGYVHGDSDMADVVNLLPALSQARLQAV